MTKSFLLLYRVRIKIETRKTFCSIINSLHCTLLWNENF